MNEHTSSLAAQVAALVQQTDLWKWVEHQMAQQAAKHAGQQAAGTGPLNYANPPPAAASSLNHEFTDIVASVERREVSAV
jgi:hypothetical protein